MGIFSLEYAVDIIYGRKFGRLELTRMAPYIFVVIEVAFTSKVSFLFHYSFHEFYPKHRNILLAVKNHLPLYLVSTMPQTLSSAFYCRKFRCDFPNCEDKEEDSFGLK